MLRLSMSLALVAVLSPVHAQSAAEQLRLQRSDETNCAWLQNYTQITISSCLLNKGDMVVIPARIISRAQAVDLMSVAAVAAEMNKKSPSTLSVGLSPSMGRFIRIKGHPVTFNGLVNPKEAMRTLGKSATDCTMKHLASQCAGEQPTKPIPAG